MQNVGLQTVLQSSIAAERVQQTAQTHGTVVAEQFKDIQDKANVLKSTEVQQTEESEQTRVTEQEERRRNSEQESKDKKEAKDREHAEEEKVASDIPIDDVPQGRLLNIRI